MRSITGFAAIVLLFAALAATAADVAADGEIHDRLMVKLAGDRDVRGSHIEVDVKDGRVTLGGWVHDNRAKKRAERLTKKEKGVKEVINNITVRPK